MKKRYLFISTLIAAICIFSTCKKKESDDPQPLASTKIDKSCNDINLFGVAKDREFGKLAFDYFTNPDSSKLVIMDSVQYSKAYAYLNGIKNEILDKNNIDNEKEFEWRLRIIKDDSTLNAFCTPGGYIFIYTGIIKYLDKEDDFAGVLGHEMGHAALRHSTQSMTKQYGTGIFLQALGYDKSVLVKAIRQLGSLSYSRCHETQADEYSVSLLSNTKYKCNGAASFFEKLLKSGSARPPEFLSTHPDPGNRVTNINIRADSLKCLNRPEFSGSGWLQFKSDLNLN
ncbi:MAG: M48 family metalloprotease [Opitutaceae bacterium]|nr:M48 family metalloprotease [Cytophagales bacterium]